MKSNSKKFGTFNDGVAFLYTKKQSHRGGVNAPRNIESLDELDFVVKLDFEESAKRERDLDFAEQEGFSLSMKIKTRLFNLVDNKSLVVIDGYLYSVKYCDKDKHKKEMWLYLEGMNEIDT